MMGEKTKTVILMQAEVNQEESGCLEYALLEHVFVVQCWPVH